MSVLLIGPEHIDFMGQAVASYAREHVETQGMADEALDFLAALSDRMRVQCAGGISLPGRFETLEKEG